MTWKHWIYLLTSVFFFLSFAFQVGWKERHTIDQWSIFAQVPYMFHLFLPPVTPSLARHTFRCPAPLKTKKRFEAIFINTAPRIKNSKSTVTTFDPAPLSPISYDTLCMCSLTAVFINQYIYLTAAAYCVCRFEWAKDTKGVSMLCKKGPFRSSPSLFSPCSLPLVCLYTFVPLSLLPPCQPFACPPITQRCKDHTVRSHRRHHFDCHLSPLMSGGPAECSSPF